MQSFICSSCGAELVCDKNTMATECCYCGNTVMIPSRFSNMLKPDYIIPFKKTKDEAIAALKNFYMGKVLLPDAFTEKNRMEAIQGMYVPYWIFDSFLEIEAVFNARDNFCWCEGSTTTTTTNHYECKRTGNMDLIRIPVDASVKMADDVMESIEPFDYQDLLPFDSAYMAGYLADKYDVSSDKAMQRTEKANQKVEAELKDIPSLQKWAELNLFHDVKGFNKVDDEPVSSNMRIKIRSSYALVPVWILTTRYEDKLYTFVMNGQTGKFVGNLPIDEEKRKKIFLVAFFYKFIVIFMILLILASIFCALFL